MERLVGGEGLYLELVELEQVAVAGEGGQQAALLRAALRAGPGGGVHLRRDAHALRVHRRLLGLQPVALQVLDLVLLVDLVVALAAGAARHVLPHAVVSLLLLHPGDVGRCTGVKEDTETNLELNHC